MCLGNRKTRENPKVAIKYCMDCVDKSKMFYCLACDEQFHRVGAPKNHRRRILVLGAGVRKVIRRRGDGVSFPLPLDYVTVRLRATIYHDNKVIYKEKKSSYLKFFAGLSGECVHIQILGAKNLAAADSGGTSDAYVVGVYSGTKLGHSRVRWKTCNPKWINESFIVPMGSHLQDPRNTPKSQRGLFRLEVYDYQMIGSHSFLGQVEIDRAKLYRIAVAAKQQPILLPLTTREFHGRFRPQLGADSYNVTVKAASAEALDMPNPLTGCYPYVKVYFGEGAGIGGGEYLGATPFCRNTVDPEWANITNEFRLPINDVLRCERKLFLLRKQIEAAMAEEIKALIGNRKSKKRCKSTIGDQAPPSAEPERTLEEIQKDNDPKKFVILRFELWDYSYLMPHSHLGTVVVGLDDLRELCPRLPRRLVRTREPPSRQDRLDATKRVLLNPPKGQNPCLAALCGARKMEDKELLEGEDDEDFWINNIDAASPPPSPLPLDLMATRWDDDSSVVTSSTLHTRPEDDFELEETNKLSAKNLALVGMPNRSLSLPQLMSPQLPLENVSDAESLAARGRSASVAVLTSSKRKTLVDSRLDPALLETQAVVDETSPDHQRQQQEQHDADPLLPLHGS